MQNRGMGPNAQTAMHVHSRPRPSACKTRARDVKQISPNILQWPFLATEVKTGQRGALTKQFCMDEYRILLRFYTCLDREELTTSEMLETKKQGTFWQTSLLKRRRKKLPRGRADRQGGRERPLNELMPLLSLSLSLSLSLFAPAALITFQVKYPR